jgi:hypothetical protein
MTGSTLILRQHRLPPCHESNISCEVGKMAVRKFCRQHQSASDEHLGQVGSLIAWLSVCIGKISPSLEFPVEVFVQLLHVVFDWPPSTPCAIIFYRLAVEYAISLTFMPVEDPFILEFVIPFVFVSLQLTRNSMKRLSAPCHQSVDVV